MKRSSILTGLFALAAIAYGSGTGDPYIFAMGLLMLGLSMVRDLLADHAEAVKEAKQ